MSNVVVISRAKNEADIVEAWVRHTAAHVDHIFVSENDSADDTLAILEALKAEGLPLTILREATVGDYQSQVFTLMMRDMAPDSDWIVPLDTDEFIETSGARFADMLMAGPQEVRALPWRTFAWDRDDDQMDINPARRMVQRLMDETPYQKISVPRRLALTGTLCQGSHFLLPAGDHGTVLPGACLGHFPLRSVDQYQLKAAIAYLQSCCVPGWDRKNGFQFSALANVHGIDAEALEFQSRRYATQKPAGWEPRTEHAPLRYLGGPLRYTKCADRFIPTLLRHAEKMALKIAELNNIAELNR